MSPTRAPLVRSRSLGFRGPFLAAAFAAAFTAIVPSVSLEASQIVLSNLTNLTEDTYVVYPGQTIIQRFTTSSSPTGWNLESVTLPLTQNSPGPFGVSVYSYTGSGPGTLIGPIGSPVNASTGLQTFTADNAGLSLAANTDYWLMFAAVGEYLIDYTNDITTTGDWTLPTSGNYGFSTDGGTTWSVFSLNRAIQFQLAASPQSAVVPEIDAAGMASALALVVGGLGLIERGRARRWLPPAAV